MSLPIDNDFLTSIEESLEDAQDKAMALAELADYLEEKNLNQTEKYVRALADKFAVLYDEYYEGWSCVGELLKLCLEASE